MGSQRFGSQNALLKRVRQYANGATLFRKAGSAEPGALPISSSGNEVAVRGYLQAAPSDLPVAQTAVSPAPLTAPPSLPIDLPAAPIQPLPAAPAPTGLATSPPLPEPTATTEPLVQAAPQSDDDDWGGQWQRMKRVFQKHQVKQAQEGAQAQEESQPAATDAAIQRAAAAAESSAGAAAESGQQPALQDAQDWPVMRKKPETAGKPPITPTAVPPPTPTPQQEEQIRAKLSDITASQPTDSSIEVHLPRRPRPTGPAPAAESPESVQRKESPAAEPPPATQPGMVPTEIGPLPADMWEILGEPVPTTEPESLDSDVVARGEDEEGNEPTASAQIETGVGPADAVQRAIAAAETPSAPAPEADLRPTLPSLSNEPVAETAVSPPTPAAQIQREPEPAQPEADSGQEGIAPPLTVETERRPSMPTETTLTEPTEGPKATLDAEAATVPSAVQRQPEQPTSTPSQPVPTSVEDPATTTRAEAVQRAIAHVEAATEQDDTRQTESGENTAVPMSAGQHQTASTPEVVSEPVASEATVSEADAPAATSQSGQVAHAPKEAITQPNVTQADNAPVSTPTTAAAATVQRQLDGPDATNLPEAALSPSEDVTDSLEVSEATAATPTSAETVQRAIAAAESTDIETAVSPPEPTAIAPSRPHPELTTGVEPTDEKSVTAASPDVAQRAMTEIEGPVAAESEMEATAVAPTADQGQPETPAGPASEAIMSDATELTSEPPATPEAVQRAAAAAEAPSVQPADVSPSLEIGETMADPVPEVWKDMEAASASPEAVQRAIAAAETATTPDDVSGQQPVPDETAVSRQSVEHQPQMPVAASEPAQTAQSQPETPVATPKPVQTTQRQPEMPAARPIDMPEPASANDPLPAAEKVQRAIAAAEAPAQPPSSAPEAQADKVEDTAVPAATSPDQASIADSGTSPVPPTEAGHGAAPDGETAVAAPPMADLPLPDTPPTGPQPPHDIAMKEAKAAELSASVMETEVVAPASPEAIQRAITQAESPTSVASDAQMSEGKTAVSESQLQRQPDVLAGPPPTAKASGEVAQPVSQETGRRAIAAAETRMVSEPANLLSATEGPTAVEAATLRQRPEKASLENISAPVPEADRLPTQAGPTISEALQRAIAVAETPAPSKQDDLLSPTNKPTAVGSTTGQPQPETVSSPTAPTGQSVSPPVPVAPATSEAVQRAISAVEAPAPSFSRPALAQTAVSAAPKPSGSQGQLEAPRARAVGSRSQAAPAASVAAQRAIAVAEAPAQPTPRLESLARNMWQIVERPSAMDSSTTTTPNIMRAVSEELLLTDDVPAGDLAITSTMPVVQRTEDDEVITDDAVEEAASEEAEVDIDKLARQVYTQLKRRLALEWERGRGKR